MKDCVAVKTILPQDDFGNSIKLAWSTATWTRTDGSLRGGGKVNANRL